MNYGRFQMNKDINRLPKAVVELKIYFIKNSFLYLIENDAGVPDANLTKVVDGVFYDIFEQKKVMTKLINSKFAPDTFKAHDIINFESLTGLFDDQSRTDLIRKLVHCNAQIRQLQQWVEKNKGKRSKAAKVKKKIIQINELSKVYKKTVKRLRKNLEVDRINNVEEMYALLYDYASTKKSKDDYYGWFDDTEYDDYRFGDSASDGGNFMKFMRQRGSSGSKLNKHEKKVFNAFGEMRPVNIDLEEDDEEDEYSYENFPNSYGLSGASFKMNGYSDDVDDEEDYLDLPSKFGSVVSDRPHFNPNDFDVETIQQIASINPELAARSLSALNSNDKYDIDEVMDEVDDENEDGVGYSSIPISTLHKTLSVTNTLSDVMSKIENVASNVPSTEEIAEAIQSQTKFIMKVMDEKLAKLEKSINVEPDVVEEEDEESTDMVEEVIEPAVEPVDVIPTATRVLLNDGVREVYAPEEVINVDINDIKESKKRKK